MFTTDGSSCRASGAKDDGASRIGTADGALAEGSAGGIAAGGLAGAWAKAGPRGSVAISAATASGGRRIGDTSDWGRQCSMERPRRPEGYGRLGPEDTSSGPGLIAAGQRPAAPGPG
ncbi:hypothetical protein GCM10011504_10400 [Siccirubricoccus deserti]|nr:hypothetical protein GCM10011504_10400 [Siccirubricoccus deserti]